MSSRVLHVDVAKGLGIAFVVLGHNWVTLHDKGELFRVIFSFHMPLFFFLSGLMFRPQQGWADLLRSKAEALLKPYSLAALIACALTAFSLWRLFWIAYGTGDKLPWVQLWFLPHLFLLFFFGKALLGATRFEARPPALRGVLLLAVLVVGYGLLPQFREVPLPWPHENGQVVYAPGLPFCADLVLVTGFYFLGGYALRERVLNWRQQPWLFALALGVFAGLQAGLDVTMDLNERVYDALLPVTLEAVSGIYLVLAVSAWLVRWPALGRALAYLGTASLFVFIFHPYFQDHVFAWIDDHVDDQDWLSVSLSFLAGLLLPLLLWEAVRRHRWLARLWLPAKRA